MTIASRIARHVGMTIIVLVALPMAVAQDIGCTPAQRASAKDAFVDCVKADRFVASIEPHPAAGVLPIEGPGSAMRERLRARWGGVEWRGAEVR